MPSHRGTNRGTIQDKSDILGWIEDRKKDGSLAGAIKGLIRRDIQERKKQ